MSGVSISVQLSMPEPDAPTTKQPQAIPLEDRVRDALDAIESGRSSHVSWIMINKLYAALKKKPSTPRIQNLIKMIEPVLAHYGYHGVEATK